MGQGELTELHGDELHGDGGVYYADPFNSLSEIRNSDAIFEF